MSKSTKCLYALVASSSLLLVYLALFLAARLDLKARAKKAWSRLRGRLPSNTRILLQTLAYYLAVTRSTCEVDNLFLVQLFNISLQTHIVNLPIGLNSPMRAKDAVRVNGIKWKVPLKSRWKSGVSIKVQHNHIKICNDKNRIC